MERQRNLDTILANHRRELAAQTAAEDAEIEARNRKRQAYRDAEKKYNNRSSLGRMFAKKPKMRDFGL